MPGLDWQLLQITDFRSSPLVPKDTVNQAKNNFYIVSVDIDATTSADFGTVFLVNFGYASVVADHWCTKISLMASSYARLPCDDLDEP